MPQPTFAHVGLDLCVGHTRVMVGPEDRIMAVAAALVSSGRVVPALDADPATDRYRSWWPLPNASQRSMIAALVQDRSRDGQAEVAAALAAEVDGLVRGRLVESGAAILPRRGVGPPCPRRGDKLVSAGTVEERIDEMITAKRDLAARVVGTGEQWLTELSTRDLRALVALSGEAE